METFSLSWENFQFNLYGVFKTLFEEKDFADVTLVSNIHANKCKYQATKQSNLARHQASKHEGVKYSCCEFTCEATFTTEWDMRKHHEYKHNSAENYCNECEYKSSISSNLIRHKRLKHGKNETPITVGNVKENQNLVLETNNTGEGNTKEYCSQEQLYKCVKIS